MVFSYLPHKSVNPYELLAIAILRQAYVDILDYYKKGEPVNHEGLEAIKWLEKGNGTLTPVIYAIHNVDNGKNYGRDEQEIHAKLLERIKAFKRIAEGKDTKKEKAILKAWQLMS